MRGGGIRRLREREKTKYLAANKAFLDAEDRWRAYEDLILVKYSTREFPPDRRELALDNAWAARNKHHRASNGNNKWPQEQARTWEHNLPW